MEDRSTALLHLELGDASAEAGAERARELARRDSAERVTWWANGAFERTDLPMRIRDGRTLVVTEAREGYEPAPPTPGAQKASIRASRRRAARYRAWSTAALDGILAYNCAVVDPGAWY